MSPERKKSDEVLLKLPNARPGVRSTRRGGSAAAPVPAEPAAAKPSAKGSMQRSAPKKITAEALRATRKPAAKTSARPAAKSAPKPGTGAKSIKPTAASRKMTAPKKSSKSAKPGAPKLSTAKPRAVAEAKLRTAQRIAPLPGPPPIDNRRRDEIINAGLHAFGEVAAVGVRSVGRVTKKLLGR